GRAGLPVDYIAELHAIAGIPGRQTDGLREPGAFRFSRDLERDAHRTVFHNADLGWSCDVAAWRQFLVLPIHIPSGPVHRLVRLDGQTRWSGQEFFVEALIEDAAQGAVLVHLDDIARIFERRLRHFERRRRGRSGGPHIVDSLAN